LYRHRKNNCKGTQEEININKKCENVVSQKPLLPTQCDSCKKIYSNYYSLYRHKKTICYKKEVIPETNENIVQTKCKFCNKLYASNKDHTCKKSDFTFNLVPFGQEDFNKLLKSTVVKICQSASKYSLQVTSSLHLNPSFPEYHNVYIPNLKSKYGKIYRGLRPPIGGHPYWEIMKIKDILQEVLVTDTQKVKLMVNMKDDIKNKHPELVIKDNLFELTKEYTNAFPNKNTLSRDMNLLKNLIYSCTNLIKKTKNTYDKYKT
jgi:uncharacterized CHY-type Zn-finger protein